MALVVIQAHDTEAGLEINVTWDKPVDMDHLSPAQEASLAMLAMLEQAIKSTNKSKLVLPEKPSIKTPNEVEG